MSNQPVFSSYARYYDLLYRDKDYAAEAKYVARYIHKHARGVRRILELGCGTGAHAMYLARMGFSVHGVDISDEMLTRAEKRKATLPAKEAERLSFTFGDVRSLQTDKIYDAVISLFHVMSYQTSNADLEEAFKSAGRHLKSGGLFLFDFWYGPAVLIQKPEVRVKRFEDDYINAIRIAEPVMNVNENVVDVNYTVFIMEKMSGHVEQLHETHRMRYLFLPEIEKTLEACGFRLITSQAWMQDVPLGSEHWAGLVIASRDKL